MIQANKIQLGICYNLLGIEISYASNQKRKHRKTHTLSHASFKVGSYKAPIRRTAGVLIGIKPMLSTERSWVFVTLWSHRIKR